MRLWLLAIFVVVYAWSQEGAQTGAKALFFEAESGKQTQIQPSADEPGKHSKAHPVATSSTPAVTGLKYYIELQGPDHQLSRVTAAHVFHSGDRIRMHVTSNVDGHLVIYQRQDAEPEERLFPSSQLTDPTGFVHRGVDTMLPGPHAWFKFDEHPGQIRLTLLLTAQGANRPKTPDGSTTLLAEADEAHSLAKATDGSKALRIEVDDAPDDKTEYKVVDRRLDSKIPAGVIATEVTVSHER